MRRIRSKICDVAHTTAGSVVGLTSSSRWISRKSLEEQLPSNIRFDPNDLASASDDLGEIGGITGEFSKKAGSAMRGMMGPAGHADGRESTAVPILGKATVDGTQYTLDRSTLFEKWRHQCPAPVGWHLSKLGCATCKMPYDQAEAVESIQLQIIKGCNMFEIDGNATDIFQGISRAFYEALQAFELDRSGFVISLRVGIIRQPLYNEEVADVMASNSAPVRNRILPVFDRFKASSLPAMQLKTGFRFDQLNDSQLGMLGLRRINGRTVAALSTDWIDAALTNIAHQARLETVDILWLEGIHTLFDGRPDDHVDDDILQLFTHLEQHVRHGNIQFYGISSPHLTVPVERNYPPLPKDANLPECFRNRPKAPEPINLYRLMEIARRAGGENHKFRFVQYPFNLTEHQAMSKPLPYDANHTLQSLAKALGLTAIGHSPIETTNMMRLPERYHNFPLEPDLKTARMNFFSVAERAVIKEMEVKEGIEKGPKSLPAIDKLFIASVYIAHQRQFTNLFFFLDWLNYELIPAFRKAVMSLKEASSADMKDWCLQYEQLTNDMFRLRRRLYEHKHGKRSATINMAIDAISPTLARCPMLNQKAINFATHGCDVVCCGFHMSRYFHEATELNPAKNGQLPIPQSELDLLCDSNDVSFANVSPPDPYMLEGAMAQEGKFGKQKSRTEDKYVVVDPQNPKFPDIPEELADGVPSGQGSRNMP
ncbi:Hypothetical protein, putative [Bodo saltans]|uniref:Uncharacterized protein n=1 Tax=Bodo saltans TaxID=75058 RepID=A0A0S4JUK7_BODSA|nr:Hypothetical protein, putative [Bodo saltans]|eukprot:CUG93068.1 Hypothetical protein, putative [Bodo saltans]